MAAGVGETMRSDQRAVSTVARPSGEGFPPASSDGSLERCSGRRSSGSDSSARHESPEGEVRKSATDSGVASLRSGRCVADGGSDGPDWASGADGGLAASWLPRAGRTALGGGVLMDRSLTTASGAAAGRRGERFCSVVGTAGDGVDVLDAIAPTGAMALGGSGRRGAPKAVPSGTATAEGTNVDRFCTAVGASEDDGAAADTPGAGILGSGTSAGAL